jgi:hypothetical protein
MKKIVILATLVLLTAGQAMAQQAPRSNQPSSSSQSAPNSQSGRSVEDITGGW